MPDGLQSKSSPRGTPPADEPSLFSSDFVASFIDRPEGEKELIGAVDTAYGQRYGPRRETLADARRSAREDLAEARRIERRAGRQVEAEPNTVLRPRTGDDPVPTPPPSLHVPLTEKVGRGFVLGVIAVAGLTAIGNVYGLVRSGPLEFLTRDENAGLALGYSTVVLLGICQLKLLPELWRARQAIWRWTALIGLALTAVWVVLFSRTFAIDIGDPLAALAQGLTGNATQPPAEATTALLNGVQLAAEIVLPAGCWFGLQARKLPETMVRVANPERRAAQERHAEALAACQQIQARLADIEREMAELERRYQAMREAALTEFSRRKAQRDINRAKAASS